MSLSEVEIKAAIYDEMVKAEIARNNIKRLNSELQKLQQPKKDADSVAKGE